LPSILLRVLALLLALAAPAGHDLSVDEAMGGHTLARHVGKTDAELIERLRREPQISSASTYTDRATAERVVGAALASAGRGFDAWRARTGRRPNFVLRYIAPATIGRSVSRGRSVSVPCTHALVVLRWDDQRHRFYVLTSYPEVTR
jgi:Bacterial CdiA-CT RNAse A domain